MISNKSCSCLKINWNHPLDSATPWLCCRAAIFLAFRVSNLTSSSIVDSADAPPTSASYVPFSRTPDGLVIQMVHRLPPARDEAKALSRWNDMTTLLNRQDHEKYHGKVIWNGQNHTWWKPFVNVHENNPWNPRKIIKKKLSSWNFVFSQKL